MTFSIDKSAWNSYRFDSFAENITVRVDNPSESGVDRYVGLEHLDPGSLTIQRWAAPDIVTAQKLRFWPGDVIFGRRRAYQKKVAQADFEGVCSAHALVLRAKPDVITEEFLPVFLSSDYFLDRAVSISVGSMSPTVNWRDLRKQEFLLPPIAEQREIATLLWAVSEHLDALRNTRNCTISMRDAYISRSLERFPLIELGSTISVVRGGSPRPINSFLTNDPDGINWIKIGDISPDGHYIESTQQRIIAEGVSRSRSVKPGDLLLSNSMSYGRPYISRIHGCIHDGWLALSYDEDMWDGELLYYMLRSPAIQRQFASKAAGSTVKNLNVELVKSVSIPRLSIQNQRRLLSEIEFSRTTIESIDAALRSSEVMLRSMSDSLFGGDDVQ